MNRIYNFNSKSHNIITWLLVAFALVYAGICLVLLYHFFHGVFLSSEASNVMLAFSPMILLLIIVAIDLVLWQLIGKEEVEITDNFINIRHKNRIFCRKVQISKSNIYTISNESNQHDILRDFWFPKLQGSIKICYKGGKWHIGRYLKNEECEKVLSDFKQNFDEARIIEKTKKHKLTLHEILFIIWLVFAVFVCIPAWFVVPAMQEKEQREKVARDSVQLAWIKQNFPKKYCYSQQEKNICGIIAIREKDSIDGNYFYSNDSNSISSKSMLCECKGVVYIVRTYKNISLVYSNDYLYEPFWIGNKYIHDSVPKCQSSVYIYDEFSALRWKE